MSTILVVAAHPDDEILGVGGTIARRVAEGDIAYALILGEGQTSRWQIREAAERAVVDELHKDTLSSANVIGYKEVFFSDFPDNRFDSVDMLDVVKSIEKYMAELKPDVVYTHHEGDLNVDHQVTARAVLTATRPFGNYPVKEIYEFETVSSTEWYFGEKSNCFSPNVFVDITNTFQKKCNAMEMYRSELCKFPHPRSLEMLEAVAKKWGGTVGKNYAEAFELVRKVI